MKGDTGPPGLSAASAFVGMVTPTLITPVTSPTVQIGELADLPPGDYIVMAKASFARPSDSTGNVRVDCTLEEVGAPPESPLDSAAVRFAAQGPAQLSFLAPAQLAGGGTVVLNCAGDTVSASDVKLTAILIDNLSVVVQPEPAP
jgi:hypothetical protein